MVELVDSHSHLHWPDYDHAEVLKNAYDAGVNRIICVGTNPKDSRAAVDFAAKHDGVWASVGLIPHEAKLGQSALQDIVGLAESPKVVAIGEIGLDYHYCHSPKTDQLKVFRYQMELAKSHDLPVIFHVRDAFDDFWPIVDDFEGVKGVIHSFTAGKKELEQALNRGLYIGLNGIVTFTKDPPQIEAIKAVPLNKLLLETDAPFLTPVPLRGKINESKNVEIIAKFLSNLRGESFEELAEATTQNALRLFKIE